MLKALSAAGAVAAAAALVLPTASIASTATDVEAVSATVRYADLNLSSQSGGDLLQGRIRQAAKQVCGIGGAAPLAEIQFNRECVAGAIASAQPAFAMAVASARHGFVTVGPGAALIVTAPRQ